MTVGYVGLGAMGRALARHLAPDGLVVLDLNPAAVDELVGCGATAATSLADLGRRCDVVILCLPKSSNVEAVLFDDGGLAAQLAPGSIVVDQTSGVPDVTRGFAERLAALGVAMVDAPVAGGVPSAVAGQITIMASGPAEALARARPVLSAISPKVFDCGRPVGSGQAVKAINNLVNTGYRMATLELLGLACRLGAGADEFTDAANAGEARSFVTQRLLPAVVEGRSSADFALGLMCKDVNQAAELSLATGTPMPVSDAARSTMNVAYAMLGPDSRLDDLVPFAERVSGSRFAAAGGRAGTIVPAATVALAAVNKAVMTEALALARRSGLDPDLFAPVMSAGSGSSLQADRLFEGGTGPATGEMMAALDDVSRTAAEAGVPLPVTNQARAHWLAAIHDRKDA